MRFSEGVEERSIATLAVGLLAICLLLVGSFTASAGWDRYDWRINRVKPYTVEHVAGGMAHAAIDRSEYMDRVRQETKPLAVFSRWVVFLLFLGFLMPLFMALASLSNLAKLVDRKNAALRDA